MSENSLTLSDYCFVNPPRWIPETITTSDLVSFIPMQDVSETGEWTTKQARKLSEVRSGFTNFKNKDVLIAKITPCFENGKGAFADNLIGGVGFGSTEFHVLRARSKTEPRFIFHLSQWERFRVAALQFMSGSAGQQRVASEFFYKYRVAKFTEDEQSIISNILDDIGTQIRETETIIAKLQQVKQGLLHDLLTRGVDENGELRPSYEDAPELYTSTSQGKIPKTWDLKTLASYTSSLITYGIVQAGPHIAGGIPYIRTGDMSGSQLSKLGMLCTTKKIAASYSRSKVNAGDIVMAIRATVGKVLPVPVDLDGANLTQGTARISPNTSTDASFLLWAIRHQRTQNAIVSEIKGTTFAEITLTALRMVLVAGPKEKSEQVLIGNQLNAAANRIDQELLMLQKLKIKKSGLMDDLLTGKKRVTDLLKQQIK